jgi:hypothetical protein
MNDDIIADLNQIVAAAVSQAPSHLATKEDTDRGFAEVRQSCTR